MSRRGSLKGTRFFPGRWCLSASLLASTIAGQAHGQPPSDETRAFVHCEMATSSRLVCSLTNPTQIRVQFQIALPSELKQILDVDDASLRGSLEPGSEKRVSFRLLSHPRWALTAEVRITLRPENTSSAVTTDVTVRVPGTDYALGEPGPRPPTAAEPPPKAAPPPPTKAAPPPPTPTAAEPPASAAPPPPPPPTPPPSVAGGPPPPVFLEPPLPTPKRPVYWNAWLSTDAGESSGAFELPPSKVPVNPFSQFYVDLSFNSLNKVFPGTAAPPIEVLEDFRDLLDLPNKTLPVRLLPIAVGDLEIAPADSKWIPASIHLDRLRSSRPPQQGETLPDYARATAVLQRDSAPGDPFFIGVRASQPTIGCGGITIAIWDRDGQAPLDHVFWPLPIGGAGCPETASARRTLNGEMLRSYATTATPAYAAAIHIFEQDVGICSAPVVIFASRSSERPFIWRLGVSLESLLDDVKGPVSALHLLTASSNPSDSITWVSETFADRLFPANSSDALLARDRLFELGGSGGAKPLVFARAVTASGRLVPLPLGLLLRPDNRPLGDLVDVLAPLPRERPPTKTGCITHFSVATLETDTSGSFQPAEYYQDHASLRRFVTAPVETPGPEGLVFLLHNGPAGLSFDSRGFPSLTPTDFVRRFPRGGAAILLACELESAKAAPSTWVGALAEQFSSIIASAFPLQTEFARHFEREFDVTVHAGPVTLIQALSNTKKRLTGLDSYLVHELSLMGDPQVQFCPPPKIPNN